MNAQESAMDEASVRARIEAEMAEISEYGSGPHCPWVLIALKQPGYGMDSGWFASLEAAFRASMAWDEPAPPGYEVD